MSPSQTRTRARTQMVAQLGLMMAGVASLTLFVRVPIPMTRGYVNLGDVAVVAFAMLAGARRGALVGGLGSALADVMGFPQFVPATLVAKGIEGYLAGFGADWAGEKRGAAAGARRFLCAFTGAGCMVATYFGYQGLLVGWDAAWVEVPANCFQMIVGTVGGTILYHLAHFTYGLERLTEQGD